MASPMGVHIPAQLTDPVIVMNFGNPSTGNISTIFFGMVDALYTDEVWGRDRSRIAHLFGITDQDCSVDIKVHDEDQLVPVVRTAIDKLNQLPQFTVLRIVAIGANKPTFADAMKTLIHGWAIPSANKQIQFVAVGESPDFFYLNFCRDLCLRKICQSLEYYNTMDYNQFGVLF